MTTPRHFQEEEYDETSRLKKKINMLEGEQRKHKKQISLLEETNKELRESLKREKEYFKREIENYKREIEKLKNENISLNKSLQVSKEIQELRLNPTQSRIIQLSEPTKEEGNKPSEENPQSYSRLNPLGWLSRPKSNTKEQKSDSPKSSLSK